MARFRSWLRSMAHRSRVEKEMDAELRFHLESYQEDLIRRGTTREEAYRQARIEFGGTEMQKEECRASLGLRMWDEVTGDLRYSLRMLRQSPGFTVVAVLSLALGIGANTAIFSLAREVLLKTMGVPHAENLRMFSWAQGPKHGDMGPMWGSFGRNDAGEMTGTPFPYPLYSQMRASLRDHNNAVDDLVAFKDVYQISATIDGQAEAVSGILLSGNFYQELAVPVIAGRAIGPSDDSVNAPGAALISDAYWMRRFGRSADALGKTISLNHVAVTIVGVNAPRFQGPKAGGTPEIFLPISLQPRVIPNPEGSLLADTGFWWVMVLGRVKPGITDAAATRILRSAFRSAVDATLSRKKESDIPQFVLISGARGLDEQQRSFQTPMLLLLGLAGVVLLTACINLANLLLARAAARHREMSVRMALGASRYRLVRQVLTECMLLAMMGGAAGLALGYLGRRVIPNLFEAPWRTNPLAIQFDWRVFAFALMATLITGLLFGLAPAWQSTQTDSNAGLKESGRMTVSRPKALVGKTLVVLQVSLSVLILVGAGLFVRTLANLKTTTLGFNPERLLLFDLEAPRARYSAAQRIGLYQRVEQKLATLPGVQSLTLSSEALLSGAMENGCYRPTGRPAQGELQAWRNLVGSRFFETLGIPIIKGRGFRSGDRQKTPRVAVINRTLAELFFPNANPIGQTVTACDPEDSKVPITVVGVSADAKYNGIRGNTPATLYLPYLQMDDVWGMTFEVKTAASTGSIMAKIRDVVRSVDAELPIMEARTQTQQIDSTLSQERVFAELTSGFGVLALVLASIGIYGIMAYTVSRRTNEIGIRMALGAQAGEVLGMVLRETTLLVGMGVAIGLAAAAALTRLVNSMLYGVNPIDPLTFLSAGVLLILVAGAAGYLPARRAAGVDPMQALRHE